LHELHLPSSSFTYFLGLGVLAGDDLLERTLAEFRKTAPFVQQLNRAVQYAYEEMM